MIRRIISYLKGNTPGKRDRLPISQIDLLQHRAADYLNAKTVSWPVQKMKRMLFCFCLVTGGLCLIIGIRAFVQTNGPPVKHNTLIKPVPGTGSKNSIH